MATDRIKTDPGFQPVMLAGVLGTSAPGIKFATDPNSPFRDGYSIAGEEAALAAFIKAGASEDDPLFDRYVELEDRKEQFQKMQAERRDRRGADAVVTNSEAQGIDDLGPLTNEGVDQMTIHTIEAHRLFQGRSGEPEKRLNAIIGGKRVASSLRNLWVLTSRDNPYADWALVRHEYGILQVQESLRAQIAKAEELLESQRKRGLSLSIVQSARPMTLNLGFRSPYGYAISMLIVDYDYFVRIQKTLQRKNLLSDEQARAVLSAMSRAILGVFYGTARFDKWLGRPEIRELSRSDWFSADPEAAKRIQFVVSTFGAVPAQIYKAEVKPSHSRRLINVSEAERALLQQVGDQLQQAQEHGSDASASTGPEATATAD